ncbi:MAG: UbiA family prenyltransferase [Thermofilaceae archaeon]
MVYREFIAYQYSGFQSFRKFAYLIILLYHNVRVRDWRAYMAMGMLGYLHYSQNLPASRFILNAIMLAITLVLYLAFAFSINNCFDVDCDRLQQRKLTKNPIASGLINFKTGLVFSLCLAFTGFLLTLIWFQPAGTPSTIYLALLTLAGFYSSPPLRFKSKPFFDLLSHSLFFGGLLYLYGASAGGGLPLYLLPIALSISLYSIILELRNHIEDFQADASAGVRTVVIRLGCKRSETILRVLLTWHWICLAAISIISYPYATVIPVAALIYLLARWESVSISSSYLRVADLATCIFYSVITFPHVLTIVLRVLTL